MKIRCERCGRRYLVVGYGIMQPACPFCGALSPLVVERRPGGVRKVSKQTHLCFGI